MYTLLLAATASFGSPLVHPNNPQDAVRLWLGQDVAWTSRQLELAPMLKFVGDAAQVEASLMEAPETEMMWGSLWV